MVLTIVSLGETPEGTLAGLWKKSDDLRRPKKGRQPFTAVVLRS
jgi:hypothetical protein